MPMKFELVYKIKLLVLANVIETESFNKNNIQLDVVCIQANQSDLSEAGYPQQELSPHALLRQLDIKQRKVLELFDDFQVVTSRQVADFCGYTHRFASVLCGDWVKQGFLTVANSSNKGRSFQLAAKFKKLIKD